MTPIPGLRVSVRLLNLAVQPTELPFIAFPAISCGVYGYPVEDAAAVSAAVVREHDWALDEIRFVLFSVESSPRGGARSNDLQKSTTESR